MAVRNESRRRRTISTYQTIRLSTDFSYDAKGAIADDFAVGVDEITSVSRLAVRGDDLDHLAGIIDC